MVFPRDIYLGLTKMNAGNRRAVPLSAQTWTTVLLRHDISDYIAGKPDAYADVLLADPCSGTAYNSRMNKYNRVFEYAKQIRRPTCYGQEVELSVAAKVLRRAIMVYVPGGDAYRPWSTYGDQFPGRPLRLLYMQYGKNGRAGIGALRTAVSGQNAPLNPLPPSPLLTLAARSKKFCVYKNKCAY